MANRLRITALVSLAMVNVCALGAGVAVARLLPGRLALWNIPRVAAAPLVAGGQVLRPAQSAGPLPTSHGLSAALAPILASRALGSHVAAVVTDPVSGAVLFSSGGSSPAEPASTAKLATGVAALAALGPGARFTTRAVAGAAAGSVVLVGGGDPTLTAGPPPASDYPRPATLASLAAAAARSLRAQGLTRVRLSYDTSLFSGPLLAPGWPTGYVSTGNVTPITSLEVDQGRLTPSGRPEDADNPGNFRPRSFDPAAVAAMAFGSFLKADGIIVTGPVAQGTAPAGAATIAAVTSPPLSAVVGWMLRESNNVIAEDLARQVALHAGAAASFSGAAAAVTRVLRGLDVSGIRLVDGSGLSPDDRVTPSALTSLVAVAAGAAHAQLRPAVTGMPVAGFSGTLAPDQSVFGHFTGPALGAVRAKTGNLDTVAAMAGLAYDRQGQVLAFAFMADQVPPGSLTQAAAEIDAMATLLAGCGCR
ncbi:MAG TPA: D-alanyl-D-alanine carboxypeptidase/D-alanyl-D-alanine-endopeptidase [Streptosporangiaceae bacterium]